MLQESEVAAIRKRAEGFGPELWKAQSTATTTIRSLLADRDELVRRLARTKTVVETMRFLSPSHAHPGADDGDCVRCLGDAALNDPLFLGAAAPVEDAAP